MMIGIVIPFLNSSIDRLDNLYFILQVLKESPIKEIIVVEQVKDISQIKLDSNFNHIIVKSDSSHIEKSKLINIGVQNLQADYLWMNDVDICHQNKFSKVLDHLDEDHIFIKPFKKFILLTKEQTDEFKQNGKLKISGTKKVLNGPCAGSFIFRKNEFIKIGGMDERYIGWGFEDMEFADRAKKIYPLVEYSDLTGIHLYHEPAKRFSAISNKNANIYSKAIMQIKKNVFKQIRNIKSPFNNRILK